MRTSTKVWLIIGAALILVGCILFAGVMHSLEWDFSLLATTKYETNTYNITESFTGISMNTSTAGIEFAPSTDGLCKVVCYEDEKEKHSVSVKGDTLTVEVKDNKKMHNIIGINFSSPKITVYLPQTEYTSLFIKESTGNVKIPKDFSFEDVFISLSTGAVDFNASATNTVQIKTTTGNINVKGTSATELDLSVSTGKVTVSEVNCEGNISVDVSTGYAELDGIYCKNLKSTGSTGDITLKKVIATEKISVERSTGDIEFDASDASEIIAETDTGDVTGTLLTDKVFIVETDTGRTDVPKTTNGGRCSITTDTGDIRIKISK